MKLLLVLSLIFNLQNNNMSDNQNEIVLGGGCFWCVEAVFDGIKGVEDIISGYSGGKIKNPSYKEVSRSLTNHAEVCKITYNKEIISLDINFTYVCTKGYSSKYSYMTQYDRRKSHLPGLIMWEIN